MMEVGRERSANALCLLGRLELVQARHCLQHFKGYPTWDPKLTETGEISEALEGTTDGVTPKLSAT